MPGLRHDVREIVSSGSVVAARITVSGTLRGTFAGVNGGHWKLLPASGSFSGVVIARLPAADRQIRYADDRG